MVNRPLFIVILCYDWRRMAEQLLNGRYRLLRPLGTGGMASVYLAEDLRLGRRVAVKILHPQFAADPAFVARFEQEARMAAALSHPSIVQVYDVGHDGGRYYIVMEYVEGETLKALIAREGALPVPRALTIIGGVLGALAFAHAHNLIHRDIKAQNILITPDGDVKVTDFGIARELNGATAPTLTVTGMVIGTVQYFAPEQAQGRPATPRSDVYAAGIVLYEMLTGKLPFDADNPLAVAMQQINQAPLPPSRLNAAIPPAVESIVLTALAKNPADRYASAGDMKAAVDAARNSAAQPTRLATRVTPAAPATPTAPGVARASTRPSPQVNVRTPAPPPAGRNTQRLLWIVAAVLIAALAAIGGIYAAGGGLPGFGSPATATPTPSATPTATHTSTPAPTATRPVIVVVPTATHTPKPTATRTPKPTATRTPQPTATQTPQPTATRTPKPTRTPRPTNTATAAPTETPKPSETPTAAATPTPTQTAPPSATPQPATAVPTQTPQPTAPPSETPAGTATAATPGASSTPPGGTPTGTAPASGAPAIQFSPTSAAPGDNVGVSGSGWPDGAVVTLTADFGSGTQTLAPNITVSNGGFTTLITIPPGTGPAVYTVTAQDDQGEQASQSLTVTGG